MPKEVPHLPPPRPVYRDKGIILLGVPVITALEYYLTYDNIRLNWLFVYEFLSDYTKILLIWLLIRWVVMRLDRRFPWQEGLVRRLAVQVPLTCLAGMLALTVLVHLEYRFLRPYPMQHFFNFDLVIALIFILLGNAIYVSLYFYDSYARSQAEKNQLAEQLRQASQPEAERFLVRSGKRETLVPYEEILLFYAEDKENYLLTGQGKVYLVEASLDKLTAQLPEALFFRANRKYILTADAVDSLQPEAYGKLLVQLRPHPRLPENLTISRDKAAAFRHWLKR